MSTDRCPRSFEAEAMRDGRLGDAERASFERHTMICPPCAREVHALDALAQALQKNIPERADELHVRRERTRLLAAFDRELLAPARHPGSRGRLAWPIVALALATTLAVLWRARTPAPSAAPATSAVVHAAGDAAWSERVEGERDEVILEQGALSIQVDHRTGHRRLVVLLPDGELEDVGTTFTVVAENRRTTRVSVAEGRVVLRLRGEPPATIGAGETWTPSAPAPAPCATSPSTAEPPPSALHLAPPVAPVPSAPVSHAPSPAPTALPTDASSEFHAAMSALDRGDNLVAATGFAGFLTAHPRDSRAEDAAYLRVIALQRSGDPDAMKAAALDYLRRYPAGFRHAEVETLSR